MIGLQNNSQKYLFFLLATLIHAQVANAMGLMLGSAVPSVQVGQIFGPLLVVLMLLFGGELLNLDRVHASLKWLQYISIIGYTNKALAQNEMQGLVFECAPQGPCIPTGELALKSVALDGIPKWDCLMINLGLSIAFGFVGFVFFVFTSRPPLKLK